MRKWWAIRSKLDERKLAIISICLRILARDEEPELVWFTRYSCGIRGKRKEEILQPGIWLEERA